MNNTIVNIQSHEYMIRLITIGKIIPTEPYKYLMFVWILTIFFRILLLIIGTFLGINRYICSWEL